MPAITLAFGDGVAAHILQASELTELFSVGRFGAGAPADDSAVSSWDAGGVQRVQRHDRQVAVPGDRMLLKGVGNEFDEGLSSATVESVVDGVRKVAERIDRTEGIGLVVPGAEDAGRWVGVMDGVLGHVVDEFGKGGRVVYPIDEAGPIKYTTARALSSALQTECQAILMRSDAHSAATVVGEIARSARIHQMAGLGGLMVSDAHILSNSGSLAMGLLQSGQRYVADLPLDTITVRADPSYARMVADTATSAIRQQKQDGGADEMVETILQGCVVEQDWS